MITASVVVFHSSYSQIDTLLKSIEKTNSIDKLYIIDNAPNEENNIYFRKCCINSIIEYIPHDNTGYGSSHNIAIKKSIELGADYHVVLNPDISFDSNVFSALEAYMNENLDVGYILPRVEYPNAELQYLCKLLPTPFELIFRRFLPKTKWKT